MQVSFELDVLGYLLMFSDMLYCKQSMNASLWRTWIGTCCLTVIHWHKWLFSVQSTLKSWFGSFVKSFCENDQKMKQHLFKEMEATRAKVTTELCAHTQTHTGTKTDLNKCQQITPVFIDTASGNNIINLRKPLGRAFNCLFLLLFFPTGESQKNMQLWICCQMSNHMKDN